MYKEEIFALVEFVSIPRTCGELAAPLGLSRQGVYLRLRKSGTRKHRLASGGIFGYNFFDLPTCWQVKIIQNFIHTPPDTSFDKNRVDAILFCAATTDLAFAKAWAQREKRIIETQHKILKIISSAGSKRC
jgi:hypothetical protein